MKRYKVWEYKTALFGFPQWAGRCNVCLQTWTNVSWQKVMDELTKHEQGRHDH